MALLSLLVVSVLCVAEGAEAAAARERWRRPLPGGAVVGSFSFDRATPYERGRRRGIDLRARPGTRVGAVCAGVVTYAGRVPRRGHGVTVRCDDGLVATELGLDAIAVARGARVWAGARIGRLAPRGVLRLGARVATRRQGYVDPATLLRDDAGPAWPTLAPAPGGAKTRTRRPPAGPAAVAPPRPAAAPVVATAPRPAAAPSAAPSAAPGPPPWPVLAGLALLLAGACAGGGVARRRRRRRVGPGIVVVQR
jgi:hypothetical protein